MEIYYNQELRNCLWVVLIHNTQSNDSWSNDRHFIQAVLLMFVDWTNKDWIFKCCKRLSFQVLRGCKLHNVFMPESCWGFRKSLKNVHLFTSGGQINSLTLQINLFWMQVPCQRALKYNLWRLNLKTQLKDWVFCAI